ncbi:MAG: M20 family metallopeptidase [Chloroflexota bacterium]
MDPKEIAHRRIDGSRDALLDLSHRVHACPELGFAETETSALVADSLELAGFRVERGACDLPTAFIARAGSGPLRIGICAEYDALPSVGHACGHNVIAAAAVGAGLGLAAVADEVGIEVVVIGTPAEEGGGGKVFMLERGGFDGIHAAMMVHPAPYETADMPMIAAGHVTVTYRGKAAHAAAFPWLGVNAGDALVVAQVAIGLLRQQLPLDVQAHGIVLKGGDAMNIIPHETVMDYMFRAPTIEGLEGVKSRILACFEAGAIATGCTVEIAQAGPDYSEVRADPDLVAAYERNARALGRVFWPDAGPEPTAASTDMGNVSLVIPSIHPAMSLDCYPAVNHQAAFTDAAGSPAGDRATIDGAIAMAWTAIDAATDPAIRARLLAGTRKD